MPSLRKNSDSFSRFILVFSLESPASQHFEEGLQTLEILHGGRMNAFSNSGETARRITLKQLKLQQILKEIRRANTNI